MDSRKIYLKAVGRLPQKQEKDNPIKGLIAQAKVEWRELEPTQRLIEFLQAKELEYMQQAVNFSSNSADEKTVNRALTKAKAIGEIIEYVNGNE